MVTLATKKTSIPKEAAQVERRFSYFQHHHLTKKKMEHLDRPRVVVPQGFRELLGSLCREILRQQPNNILEFSAQYFEEKLRERDGGDRVPEVEHIPSHDLIKCALQLGEVTPEVQNVAAVHIQKYYRGYRARQLVADMRKVSSLVMEDKLEETADSDDQQAMTSGLGCEGDRIGIEFQNSSLKIDDFWMTCKMTLKESMIKCIQNGCQVCFGLNIVVMVWPVFVGPSSTTEENETAIVPVVRDPSQLRQLRSMLQVWLPIPRNGNIPHRTYPSLGNYMASRIRLHSTTSPDINWEMNTLPLPPPPPPPNTPVGSSDDILPAATAIALAAAPAPDSSTERLPPVPPNTPRPSFSDFTSWIHLASSQHRLASANAHSELGLASPDSAIGTSRIVDSHVSASAIGKTSSNCSGEEAFAVDQEQIQKSMEDESESALYPAVGGITAEDAWQSHEDVLPDHSHERLGDAEEEEKKSEDAKLS